MTLILASGRWDNNIAVIDVARALDRAHDATDRAVLARPRATPDVEGAPASGQPVNICVPPGSPCAYVVNHSGLASSAQAGAYQHGHPGTLTVLDRARLLASDGTTGAIAGVIELGICGPVGIAATPDGAQLLVSSAEAAGAEDGGAEIAVVELAAHRVLAPIRLAHGPGEPCRADNPHPDYGRFPNPNGIAVTPDGLLVTANGGTDDASLVSLATREELARVPTQSGGFGVSVSPDGRLAAVASRESMRTGEFGNTVSVIDLAARREIARVRVGTDDPAEGTRPFVAAFTPDGARLVVSCFRSNTLSLLDIASAREVKRLVLEDPTGGPARPRGVLVSAEGWVAVTGGQKRGPRSSLLWMLDLERFEVVARTMGIGNETYLLAACEPA
jgi:DNA-binding beta-propeller fold protein YncE